MDMINELNILVGFFLFWGVYWLAKTLWRQLRLRRAFFILSRQIAWALKYAPRDKLVLDVGAGSNPHIRADVICEKFSMMIFIVVGRSQLTDRLLSVMQVRYHSKIIYSM